MMLRASIGDPKQPWLYIMILVVPSLAALSPHEPRKLQELLSLLAPVIMLAMDPNEIPGFISVYRYETYSQLALGASIFYSTITTMDKEAKHFWAVPLNSVNVVYFLNRYIGLFAGFVYPAFTGSFHANETICNSTAWGKDLSDTVTLVLVDYILMIRVLALWSQERRLAFWLKTMLFAESVIMVTSLILEELAEKISIGGADGFVFCGIDGYASPVFQTMYWSVSLLFETILLNLAIYKAAKLWRTSLGIDGLMLMKVLIQDQLIYFILVMMCGVTNFIAYWALPDAVANNPVLIVIIQLTSSPVIPCITASRIMVHLKEAAEKGQNGGTSYDSASVSTMEFI